MYDMLPKIVYSPEQRLPIEEISSPLMLDLSDHGLFQETLQNSDVTSSSNCCFEDSSYATNLSFPDPNYIENNFTSYQDNNAAASTTVTAGSATTTDTANNNLSNLSIIFDPHEEIDNDITASIDFSPSSTFSIPQDLTVRPDPFDFSPVQPQNSVVGGLPVTFEDHLYSMPPYMSLNHSSATCSFLAPAIGTYIPTELTNAGVLSFDGARIVNGGFRMAGSELQSPELDYHGDGCGNLHLDKHRFFNHGDFQVYGNEAQKLVGGGGSCASLTTELSGLDESISKAVKLSVEERKEKIHRYLKKRNQRNFNKKIKYACRKALADSRPRVRGRFAKNDDFGETHRAGSSNHEEDDEVDQVIAKKGDEMVDSSDIFAHISGVNSFNCNYPIHSWIGLN